MLRRVSDVVDAIRRQGPDERTEVVVGTLLEAFEPLIAADPAAFRRKFRTMAASPWAFYRGTACLFYADVAAGEDPYADERTSRVWIQGDLHAENYGTYMDDQGVLVFDVNDFDEAYVGHFTWDVRRMAASVALLGITKAFSDADLARLVAVYARAYADQVRTFATTAGDTSYALRLDNTTGLVHEVLQAARASTRIHLLERDTVVADRDRRFRDGPGVRRLDEEERTGVEEAFYRYLETIPAAKRQPRSSYVIKDVVGRSGFGIGSAGLPAYNVLLEGRTQALENDVVLGLKQGNVAAPSRVVDDADVRAYFTDHGHRTAVSQRALQAHADPWLGHTSLGGRGWVVAEVSPYQADLDWSAVTEPDEAAAVLDALGRATAKVHCVSDEGSDQTLVRFQTEEAVTEVLEAAPGGVDGFVDWVVDFGLSYAGLVRDDFRLFVDAFRNGRIPGL
jgi:uncharacterized protein (DUF2252 family)